MNRVFKNIIVVIGAGVMFLVLPAWAPAQNDQLTYEDIMKWEDISDVNISVVAEISDRRKQSGNPDGGWPGSSNYL